MILCVAATSTATLAAQQPWTDGTITIDSGMQTRAVVNSPALPPNSTELFYDSGDFQGSSRNLQNQDIIPGWSYWAHAVRFTPTGSATGQLLEVRYVASTQWGTSLAYDLLIRDAAGLVLGILPNQTAVMDTANWTVVDVSSLGINVGSSDFTVEMRPANPCGGDTGFTIAYSNLGSGRSSISADCADTFVSFLPESLDLFLRAVVEDAPTGPTLSITNLAAGQIATFDGAGLTPSQAALIGFSTNGGGPTATPFGLVDLTPPFGTLPLFADAVGDASLSINVPPGASGLSIWFQIVDTASQTLGQSIATQVL